MSGHKEAKSAHWCYTWNNPNVTPDQHNDSFDGLNPAAHIFQEEVGDSGTPHFQGYLEFKSAKSLKQLRSCNPQIHYEVRRGTQAQAVAYVSKCCGKHYEDIAADGCSDDKRLAGPFRFGTLKSNSRGGMSPDFVEQIKCGKRLRELVSTHVDDVRKYPRFYSEVRRLFAPPPREAAPRVVLLIGPPGCGKTRRVRTSVDANDLFVKPVDRGFWMDGYDLHPHVLLDDFAGASNHVSLVNLLQLLDRYAQQVPIKGGFTWWQPDTIWITTNIHPAKWYVWDDRMEQWGALRRRITDVFDFSVDGEAPIGGDRLDEFWRYNAHATAWNRTTQEF